jgi:hypothetical protein
MQRQQAGLRVALVAGGAELHRWLLRALTAPPSLLGQGYVFASLARENAARPGFASDFDLVFLEIGSTGDLGAFQELRRAAPALPAILLGHDGGQLQPSLLGDARTIALATPLRAEALRHAVTELLR